jgi:hypothetical protein
MMHKTLSKMKSLFLLHLFFIGSLVWVLIPARSVHAADITVNTETDVLDANGGDCSTMGISDLPGPDGLVSLREAICAANNTSGADVINFDSSLNTPIVLTISGASNEHAAEWGDLDIADDLTIYGNGVMNTMIDASGLSPRERVFHILSGTTVEINDLTITGGLSPDLGGGFADPNTWGGGILNNGNLTLNQVQVTKNEAGTRGGGLYFQGGTSTINNSTIYTNTSTTSGAGIFADAALTINNSTISDNTSADNGGGVFVFNNTTTLNYVTVVHNRADSDNFNGGYGGGLSNLFGTLNIMSSLIAYNTVGSTGSGSQCGGGMSFNPITSLDYNLIQTTTDCTITGTTTNNLTGDPLAGALADNGGPTLTHALAVNSPAIDHIPNGTNGCDTTYTTDQRGSIRPIDGDNDGDADCDIGAVESLQVCNVSEGTYTLGNVTFFIPTGGDGDIDCFRVLEFDQNHPNATPNLETGKYWQLEATQSDGSPASGYSINLTIAGLTFTADADDKLCRWDVSLWDCAASSFSGTSITRNAVTQLSPWTAGNNVGPTDITLTSFTARSTDIPLILTAFALLGSALLLFIRKRWV